jgi:hypothetical protein
MYIDTLTIAGIIASSLFLLLPLWFGRELIRVEEEGADRSPVPCGEPVTEPCLEQSGAN